MKNLVIMILLSIMSFAQAQSLPEPTSIKNPTLRCSHPGGMIAINLKEKRAWTGSPAENIGFELDNVKVKVFRCANCYEITGTLFGSDVHVKVTDQNKKPVAVMTLSSPDAEGDGPMEIDEFPGLTCKHHK